MSGQGALSHPTSCPVLAPSSSLLSSLLADGIRIPLSTDSLGTQMSLNFGTELSNMKFQAEVSCESLCYEPVFPRLSKASVELRTGDLSTCRENLISLFKAASVQEVATI